MNYQVLTDEDLAEQRLGLKPGPATFEIANAEDKISKSGTEMIKLTLKVWDSTGKEGTIFDYLLPTGQWKIKNFFDSIGSPKDYLSGNLDPFILLTATGKCELAIQKDSTGRYGDQIKIKDYLKREADFKAPVKDDNIPF